MSLMARFPEDFAGLLIPVAILEAVAGIFKSKFDDRRPFWAGLFIEIACAATQSAALIVTVTRTSYSRVEIAAAYLTIIVDALLLLLEAVCAGFTLFVGPVAGKFTLFVCAVSSPVVGMSGVPIYVPKLQGRALKRFKAHVPGILILSLPLLAALVGMLSVHRLVSYKSSVSDLTLSATLVSTMLSALALGIVILTSSENLSLSFLVIANLYPALLTLMVVTTRRSVSQGGDLQRSIYCPIQRMIGHVHLHGPHCRIVLRRFDSRSALHTKLLGL